MSKTIIKQFEPVNVERADDQLIFYFAANSIHLIRKNGLYVYVPSGTHRLVVSIANINRCLNPDDQFAFRQGQTLLVVSARELFNMTDIAAVMFEYMQDHRLFESLEVSNKQTIVMPRKAEKNDYDVNAFLDEMLVKGRLATIDTAIDDALQVNDIERLKELGEMRASLLKAQPPKQA